MQDLSERVELVVEEPFDVLAFCADWMDDGMRVVFASGTIIAAISFVKEALISARSAVIYGFFWNYIDAIDGVLAAMQGYRNAQNAKQNASAKYAFATVDLAGSIQLTVDTTLTI